MTLCKQCEGVVFGLLNELKHEAVRMKRGTLVLDAISDLEVSIRDGHIEQVKRRDRAYASGKRPGRKLKK